ncbi:MAG: hypothetical protein ACTH2Q_13795 [Propionibacteriaceae bacterium]
MDDEFPLRWETFLIDGSPAGVLARRLHPAGLDTLTCFREPAGSLVHLEHTLSFTGDPRAWTRFRYRQIHEGIEIKRSAEDTVADVVPSYGEFAMLDQLDLGSEFGYRAVLEATPDEPPVEVLLRAVGSEVVTTPEGTSIDCTRVEVTEDGTRSNTHWLDSSGLRASDWNGATSWRVAGRNELPGVAGMPEVIDGWLATLG